MQSATVDQPPPPTGIRGQYQLPHTKMTLREGLAEYYRVNPGLSVPEQITNPTSAAYFHNHDCTHVIFGTHTGPLDEGVNDMLTILGVDIRLRDYAMGFFATDEARAIMQQFPLRKTVPLLWQTMKLLPSIRRHSRKMTKKWPWAPPAELLDRPLDELREEYGIELFRAEIELGLATEPVVAAGA